MSGYLLDSGPLTAYVLDREPVVSRIDDLDGVAEVATSILVYAETMEYFLARPDFERCRDALWAFIERITLLPVSYAVGERYARLRRQLRPPHGPGLIGDVDTFIAATALEHDLTVVTMDTDFRRVPGLDVLILDRPIR